VFLVEFLFAAFLLSWITAEYLNFRSYETDIKFIKAWRVEHDWLLWNFRQIWDFLSHLFGIRFMMFDFFGELRSEIVFNYFETNFSIKNIFIMPVMLVWSRKFWDFFFKFKEIEWNSPSWGFFPIIPHGCASKR